MSKPTPQIRWLSRVLIPLIALGLAVTTPQASGKDRPERKKDRTCIHVSSINGFNPIDSKHLTVSSGASKTHLVTLFSRYHELKWSEKIAISASTSWTCSNSKDKIIVDGERCLITKIEKVENRAAAKKLVEGRNPKRHSD